VLPVAQAAAEADIVMMLVPDEIAPDVYARDIAESMTPGKFLAFSHGFSIHYGFIKPPKDVSVFMVAPKGPGHLVRHEYKRGAGVPSLLAIHQESDWRYKKDRLALRILMDRQQAWHSGATLVFMAPLSVQDPSAPP